MRMKKGLHRPGRAFGWMAAACALLGCQGKAPPAPVLVGHVAALSGPDKAQGEAAQRGMKLALKEINTKDDPRPLQVIHADTRGQSGAFEAEGVRLVTLNRV